MLLLIIMPSIPLQIHLLGLASGPVQGLWPPLSKIRSD